MNHDQNLIKIEADKIIFDGIVWQPFVHRNMSFWHQYLSNLGHYYNFRDFGIDVQVRFLTITFNGTETQVFFSAENMKQVENTVEKIITSVDRIDELKNKYDKFGKDLMSSCDQLINNNSVNSWRDFVKDYTRYTSGLPITTIIGRRGGNLLLEKLENIGFSKQTAETYLPILSYPENHTPLFESQVEMLKIGAQLQRENSSESIKTDLLNGWLKDFGHIPVNYCENPWMLGNAEEQLAVVMKKNCRDELNKILDNHQNRIRKRKELLNEINNSEVGAFSYALQEGTYLNEYRKNIFSKVSLEVRTFFKYVAEMAKLSSWRDCYFLTPDEIASFFEGQVKIIDTVAQRSVIAIYTTEDGKEEFLDDRNKEILTNFVRGIKNFKKSPDILNQTDIRGSVACQGKVQGIAKVILSSKDFSKFNDGEILVTTMTSVDFVPIMEKAAAFVTNEGGITSHASIVAREMNKPCIIGTKIATKVLKDGDLVEVDANKGTVKIIKD